MGWLSDLSEDQLRWFNEGIDHHPLPLEDCPYEVGSEAYNHFEEGWWLIDDGF
jgi:hypothetical protein